MQDINLIQYMWMFYNWIEDQIEKNELTKNHAYSIGMFINPEMVAKLTGQDGSSKVESSDEDFEQTLKIIRSDVMKDTTPTTNKRKRKIKK